MPRLSPTHNSFEWELATLMSRAYLTKELLLTVPVMTFRRWSRNPQQAMVEHMSHLLITPQPLYHR